MAELMLVTTLCNECAERRAPLHIVRSGDGVRRRCERCSVKGYDVSIYKCVALIPHPEYFGEPVIDEEAITRIHIEKLVEIGLAFIEGFLTGKSVAARNVAVAFNCSLSDLNIVPPSYPDVRDWLSCQDIVYHAEESEAQRAALWITQRQQDRGSFSQP